MITFSYNEDDQIENIFYSDSQYTDQLRFTYSYDSYGRLAIYEDVINGITEYYEYDFSGNLHRITNNLDEEIIYDYDDQSNLSGITYNFGSETSTIVYNHQSGIDFEFYDYTTFNNGSNTIKKDYNYEEYGLRRLEEVEFLRNGYHELYLNYEYDGDTTRIKQITYNIISSTSCDIAYRYTYDNVGNITKEQYYEDGSILVTRYFTYDSYNQLIQEDSRDLTYSTANSYEDTNYSRYYYYDENGNVTYIRSYKYGDDDFKSYTIPSFLQNNSGMADARVIYNSSNYYDDIYEINLNQSTSLSFTYTDMDTGNLLTHMSTTLLYSNLDNSAEGYYYNYYEATDGFFYTVRFRVVIKVGNPVSGWNTPEEYVSYSYDSDWKDQLESYTILKDGTTNTSQITYDNQGNPTQITNFKYKDTIYNKAVLDWEGRSLINIKVYNSSLAVIAEIDYTYNDQGVRIQKIIDDSVGKIKFEYKLSGTQLLAEIKSEYDEVSEEWDILYKMIYSYDYNGSFIGLSYTSGTGTPIDYIVVTNIQGDVTHLLTAYGIEVVHYQYDAYGNLISVTGAFASTIGQYNSLRYRSYIFDSDINLYYLNSRYYDTKIARFINADGLFSAIGNVRSNMFSYCENNPVIMIDSYGTDAILIADYDDKGLKVFGHSVLLIEDEDGVWWITEFTGSDKSNASVRCRKMEQSDWDRFEEPTGFWNAIKRAFNFAGNDQVYLEGDYTASLDLAISYRDNGDYGNYNLFTNNCNHYVKELLRAGDSDSLLITVQHAVSLNIVPTTFVRNTARVKFVSQVISNFKPIFLDIFVSKDD